MFHVIRYHPQPVAHRRIMVFVSWFPICHSHSPRSSSVVWAYLIAFGCNSIGPVSCYFIKNYDPAWTPNRGTHAHTTNIIWYSISRTWALPFSCNPTGNPRLRSISITAGNFEHLINYNRVYTVAHEAGADMNWFRDIWWWLECAVIQRYRDTVTYRSMFCVQVN